MKIITYNLINNNHFILQWLKTTFLPWLKKWEEQVKSQKDVKGEAKRKMLLSDETLLGLRMTGMYII